MVETALEEAGILSELGQLALLLLIEADTNEVESAVYPIDAYEEANCLALIAK
jgi:hypothetical protein